MTHKRLAKSILAACITTTALSCGMAIAADEPALSFYPKHKWTVERVDTGDAQKKVCTISNQLNNGYIVQLAGTPTGLTNLNIDFRQNVFESGKKYEVQYSVPGIVDDVVPTKAFKPNLIVSDLRGQNAFAEAVKSASVLDVSIQGNSFRMYMTGLSATMKDYTECLNPAQSQVMAKQNIKTPRQPKAVTNVNAPPPPMPDMEDLIEAKNAAQKKRALTADQKRPDTADRPRYTEMLAEQLKEESKEYIPEAKQKTASAELDEIYNTKKAAPEPDIEVPAQKQNQTDIKQDETPVAAATQSSRVTKESIQSPKAQINKTTLKSKDVIDLTTPTQAEETAAKAEEEIKVEIVQHDSPTPAPAQTRTEPASGTQERALQDDKFVMMRNKISDLEERVHMLQNKNSMLEGELKNTLQDAKDERLSVASDNWNLERATMKFNEAERQIMRLGRQLQTQKTQCEMEKKELEAMLFDPKVTSQQQLAKLASLEAELDEAKSKLYRQQRQYEERIRLLEEQLNGTH